jgi:hypothetical protein
MILYYSQLFYDLHKEGEGLYRTYRNMVQRALHLIKLKHYVRFGKLTGSSLNNKYVGET